MGESFIPFYNHFVDFLKANASVKLAFNPGSWQLRSGIETLKPVFDITDIVYVNREEAEKLTDFGDSTGHDKELLKALSSLGPKISIITDGANGSFLYASEENKYFKCGIMPVDAYERTGAGDAFGSACISALMKGKNYQEALMWGTVNSASVIGYTGSEKGLLKEEEIPAWLERAKSSGVEVKEI
jgi:sugar/nucleoside kinase (ribokinase family)